MDEPHNPTANDGRRLAAIVFTDVVGYSARMQRDETGTIALVQADFTRMRSLCSQHGGEVLKSMGDGLLLCFSSVVQAVACAVQIQVDFAARRPEDLWHRIGIHLGDVFRESGDVVGDGVNIAARLEAKARPGTICVSQSVYDAVKGKLKLQAESLGPQQLKNIAEPITVYLIIPSGAPRPLALAEKPAGKKFHWWVAGSALVLAAVLVVVFWPHPATSARFAPPAPAAAGNDAGRLVAQARALFSAIDGTRDSLALAEELTRKATELDPASADAMAARGWVTYYSYLRGWGSTPARLEAALSFANQALALSPNQPEALLTVASVLSTQHSDDVRAEAMFRQAMQSDPRDNRARRGLSTLLARTKRLPEAIAVLQEANRIDPNDAIAHYELAVRFVSNWDFPSAWKALDEALAVHSFPNGWTLKAIISANWKGDLSGMQRALDRLTSAERAEDRAVYLQMWCALMERAPNLTLDAARLTPRDYFDDIFFRGPKGWLTGMAHGLLGHVNLAQLDYAAAETVLRARLARSPDNQHDQLCLAITLALEGHVNEARREAEPFESAAREQSSPEQARLLAMYHAVLGDDSGTVAFLRRVDDPFGGFVAITPPVLRLDPWWDKLRGKPEFEALLIDPKYCPALRQ
jgi:class 3 adenylate cyclase/tetratricopeptide (TPR) repeat protein